jgi:hypothetical protein
MQDLFKMLNSESPRNIQIKTGINELTNINAKYYGTTLLCIACKNHNATIVKYLINKGADAGILCDGKTPLLYTVDVANSFFDNSPEYKVEIINYIVDLILATGTARPEHRINNIDKSVLLLTTSIFWLESTAIKIWIYLVNNNMQEIVNNQTKTLIEQNALKNKMHKFLWHFNNYNKTGITLYSLKQNDIDIDPESVEMLQSYLKGGRKTKRENKNRRTKKQVKNINY